MGQSSLPNSTFSTNVLIALAFLGTVNIVLHVLPTMVFAVILLTIQLFFVSKKDNGVVFIALGSVIGAVFATNGIRFVGVGLMAVGFLLLYKDYLSNSRELAPSIVILLVIFALLLFSVLSTSGGTYARTKLIGTIVNAALYFLSYGHILLYSKEHNGKHLGFLYLCYATVMMMYINELSGDGSTLSSLLRLGGFRNEWDEYRNGANDEDVFSFNYQTVGLDVCIGFALFFLSDREKGSRFQNFVIWALSILLVVYSGSRQSIYAFVAILFIYSLVKSNKGISKTGIVVLLGIGLVLVILQSNASLFDFLLGSDEVSSDSTRSMIRAEAMSAFTRNPFMGVGYGRFVYLGEYGIDEHNIIVEILAELGVVGMFILTVLFSRVFFLNWIFIVKNKKTLFSFIAIFTAVLVRCMVSTSMIEGIMLFVLISLLLPYKKIRK